MQCDLAIELSLLGLFPLPVAINHCLNQLFLGKAKSCTAHRIHCPSQVDQIPRGGLLKNRKGRNGQNTLSLSFDCCVSVIHQNRIGLELNSQRKRFAFAITNLLLGTKSEVSALLTFSQTGRDCIQSLTGYGVFGRCSSSATFSGMRTSPKSLSRI